jgi:hypothetical protein
MKVSTGNPPHILFCPSTRHLPADLDRLNLHDLRKKARYWVDAANKLPKDALLAALRKAMEDAVVATRVLRSLDSQERAVAAVYRRYGGSVNGEVIRLDLMARGLLQIKEKQVSDFYTSRQWQRDPVRSLADQWILLSERDHLAYYFSFLAMAKVRTDRSRAIAYTPASPNMSSPPGLLLGRLLLPRTSHKPSPGARRPKRPSIYPVFSTTWRDVARSRSGGTVLSVLPLFEPWRRLCRWTTDPIFNFLIRMASIASCSGTPGRFMFKEMRPFLTWARRPGNSTSRASSKLTPGYTVGYRPGVGLTAVEYREVRIQRSR